MARLRSFFAERGVLEVDTPILASFGVTDPAIEPLMVTTGSALSQPRYLQTSPEFAMKRLLASGSGPIYQLGKAFRDGEEGSRHNPEFTMLEWYRPGYTLDELIDEVGELVCACLQHTDWRRYTYRELFLQELALDPFTASKTALATAAGERIDSGQLCMDRDGWLDLLMSHCIEPALPSGLVFVVEYPPSQAALARLETHDNSVVAARFELFVDGVELANGYRELLDPQELAERAAMDNARRKDAGQTEHKLDTRLLAAMQSGLPDCSGVALGFDRLLMLELGVDAIGDVLAYNWARS